MAKMWIIVKAVIALLVLLLSLAKDWPKSISWLPPRWTWKVRVWTPIVLVALLFLKEILALFQSPPLTQEHFDRTSDAQRTFQAQEFDRIRSDVQMLLSDRVYSDSVVQLLRLADARFSRAYDQAKREFAVREYRSAVAIALSVYDDEMHAQSAVTICNLLANGYFRMRIFDSAQTWIERALALDSRNSQIASNRGVILEAKGADSAALASFEDAIEMDSGNVAAWINRGLSRESAGDKMGAIADYSKAVSLDANRVQAWNNRGCLYTELRRYDDAFSDFLVSTKIDSTYSFGLANLGKAYLKRKDTATCLTYLSRAISANPYHAMALYDRGLIRQTQGDLGSAEMDYSAAIAANKRLKQAWNNRAFVYMMMGKDARALQDIDSAISIDSCYTGAWSNRSAVMVNERQLPAALLSADRAIACDSLSAEAWMNRAIALHLSHADPRLIRASLDHVILARPDFEPARELRRQLDNADENTQD
jgi:tetratricopeptide (TPR) repeat protein